MSIYFWKERNLKTTMYNFALEKGLKWLLSVQLERNIANIWLKTVINQISPINIPVPFFWTKDHLDSSRRPDLDFLKNQIQNAFWKMLYQKMKKKGKEKGKRKKRRKIRKLNFFTIKINKVNRPSLRYLTNLCNVYHAQRINRIANVNRSIWRFKSVDRHDLDHWSRVNEASHVARTRETRSPIQQRRGDRLEIGSRRRW